MSVTLQEIVSQGKNGCCVLPGTYELDRPLRIPSPANGIYQFACMPGAIFHVAKGVALFDLSLLDALDAVDVTDLFLILEGGNVIASSNSSQLYVRNLLASAPSSLSYISFMVNAVTGHEVWRTKEGA